MNSAELFGDVRDQFFLSGLDKGRWFGEHFEEFHLFGYVGDRERLSEFTSRKSIGRRLLEILGPRINIGSILNALAELPLTSVDLNKTLAKQIIDLVSECRTGAISPAHWSVSTPRQ